MSFQSSPSLSSEVAFRSVLDTTKPLALGVGTSSADASHSSTPSSEVHTTFSFSVKPAPPISQRFSISELTSPTSKHVRFHKSNTDHILNGARNANIPLLPHRHQKKKQSISARRRRQAQQDSDCEGSYDTNKQRSRKPKIKSSEQMEAEERRMVQRKAELENDPLLDAHKMCPDRVWCIPCQKYIQIDSRRQYYATLWYKHRGKRHQGVPLECLELTNSSTHSDSDVEMEDFESSTVKSPMALAVPVIDDAFATTILAEMYSKAQGLRLLSLAAAALS